MTLAGTGAKEYSMYAGGVVLAGLILLASRGVPARLSRTGVLAGAVSAFVVASAGERGTILALVLALVVLGLIEGGRMRKVGWFVTAVILVGVTTNLLSLKGMLAPEVASRFSVEDVVATGGTGRLAIWSKGLALFRQSPVIGHGLKTFAPLFTSGRAFPLIRGPVGGRSPHNDLLGIAVDLGMIGVLLYLAFVGWASVRPLRVRTSVGGSQLRVLPLLVSGLLIYWVCGGLTSEVFYLKTFWLLLGLSYAVSRAPTPQDESGLATEASWIPDPP
jgi:O-antigen ligase